MADGQYVASQPKSDARLVRVRPFNEGSQPVQLESSRHQLSLLVVAVDHVEEGAIQSELS